MSAPSTDDAQARWMARLRVHARRYLPAWRGLSASDPGVVLMELFAWLMAQLDARIDRLPEELDGAMVRLLGVVPRAAQPATTWLSLRSGRVGHVPVMAGARCSAVGADVPFLTLDTVCATSARVHRIVAVSIGDDVRAREVAPGEHPTMARIGWSASADGRLLPPGAGRQAPATRCHLFVHHSLVRGGTWRLTTCTDDPWSIGACFDWEVADEGAWRPVSLVSVGVDGRGLPDVVLVVPALVDGRVGPWVDGTSPIPPPEGLPSAPWLRGTFRLARWWARCWARDLAVSWSDDRGGESIAARHVEVRAIEGAVELCVSGVPPLDTGGTLYLVVVDRGVFEAGGRPDVVVQIRDEAGWSDIPATRVRRRGARLEVSGPLPALDGVWSLRVRPARAVSPDEVVHEVHLHERREALTLRACGPDAASARVLGDAVGPWAPMCPTAGVSHREGWALWLGSTSWGAPIAGPHQLLLDLEVPGAAAHALVSICAGEGLAPVGEPLRLDGSGRLSACIGLPQAPDVHSVAGVVVPWVRIEIDHPPAPGRMVEVTRAEILPVHDEGASWGTIDRDVVVATAAVCDWAPCLNRVHIGGRSVSLGADPGPILIEGSPHDAIYIELDPPLPPGASHGAVWLSDRVTGRKAVWEGRSPSGWVRLSSAATPDGTRVVWSTHEPLAWLRMWWSPDEAPPVPGRLVLGAVRAWSVRPRGEERFDGLELDGQVLPLAHRPVVEDPSHWQVVAVDAAGRETSWRVVGEEDWPEVGPGERALRLDAHRGTLSVGDGGAGALLPAGIGNVRVASYLQVPGACANLGRGSIVAVEDHPGVEVYQPMAASGGTDTEPMASVRRRARAERRAVSRLVDPSDVEPLLARCAPEVRRASVVSAADAVLDVVVWAPGLDPVEQRSLVEVAQRALTPRCVLPWRPRVRWVERVVFDVVVMDHAEALPAALGAALARWLSPDGGPANGWPFGARLAHRELREVARPIGASHRIGSLALRPAPVSGSGWVATRDGYQLAPDALPAFGRLMIASEATC